MDEKQAINQTQEPPPYPGMAANYGTQPTLPYPPKPDAEPQYPQYAPQGAPGYGVPPPPPGNTVVVVQHHLTQFPATCVCPNCRQTVITQTIPEVGLFTWLLVGLIILFGGWIFCLCLIPLCIDSLKDIRHVCPNCSYTIYVYKRM